MGIRIQDGMGSGSAAEVKNNKLRTYSVVEEEQAHSNEEGNMFSILIDQATADVNDQFFYIKNTGDDDLMITSMKGFVSADTEIKLIINVTGTPTSGSALTPVNRNGGSAKTISSTIEQGANIQMSNGDPVDLIRFDSAATGVVKFSWGSGIILPKNATLCLESSAAATINLTISCFTHS